MNINLEWYALYYLVECKRKETNSFDKKVYFPSQRINAQKLLAKFDIYHLNLCGVFLKPRL